MLPGQAFAYHPDPLIDLVKLDLQIADSGKVSVEPFMPLGPELAAGGAVALEVSEVRAGLLQLLQQPIPLTGVGNDLGDAVNLGEDQAFDVLFDRRR